LENRRSILHRIHPLPGVETGFFQPYLWLAIECSLEVRFHPLRTRKRHPKRVRIYNLKGGL
jgi:hypothetical protein